MRTTYEEQLQKLEAKRLALQKKLEEARAKNVVLTGEEPHLQPAVKAFKEVAEKMNLPEKNVMQGLAKAIMGDVICTFRRPRGARKTGAKKKK